MIDERDFEEMDELVSKTYRELETPRTPEHLNQRVLHMAAGSGKVQLLLAAWMKPVALVATIGISLAIAVELSNLPSVPTPLDTAPVDGSSQDKPESVAEETLEELILDSAEPFKNEARRMNDSFAASAPAASFERSIQREESDPAARCDATAKQTADDWLDCIENLRKSGATVDADREYEAFILIFPAE